MLRRLFGHLDEARDRELRERRTHRVLREQVAPNESHVRLADLRIRRTRRMVRDSSHIDAAVGYAAPDQGNVHHRGILTNLICYWLFTICYLKHRIAMPLRDSKLSNNQ